jgi:AmiR/NasT family two-component response regulator
MNSRDLIGQAKGILMERHKLTASQAFAVLTQVSQEKNRKLVDIAGEVTVSGEVPAPRSPQ